jgi:heme-degrading monooxygenase HmoA
VNASRPVVSVLELLARAGSEQALIDYYEAHGVFEHARRSGGFRSGQLLAPQEGGAAFLVVAVWDNAASYQDWLDNPVRAELGVGLTPLLESEPARGVLYEQVG